jgi:hypothetical protein
MALRIASHRGALVLGASAALAFGLLLGAGAPAQADPSYWARAHGRRDHRRSNHYRRSSTGYGAKDRYGDWDGDGIPNYRDRDRDNDGVRNGRDDIPYSLPAHERARRSSRVGYGPNDRYGDRDGDGIPNYRDRHPNRRDR